MGKYEYDAGDDYYPYKPQRGWRWLGYVAVFAAGVLLGGLVFGRAGCGQPKKPAAPTVAVAPTAATAEVTSPPTAAPTAATAADTGMVLEEEPEAEPAPGPKPRPEVSYNYKPTPMKPTPLPKGGTTRTASSIHTTISKRVPGIQAEYNAQLKRNPRLGGGKVAIRFVITPRGDVRSVEVTEDTLGCPDLTAAIVARVKGWKFGPAQGDATVTYPFVFIAAG